MTLFIETTTTIIVHEDVAAEETTTPVEADIAEEDDKDDPTLMESSISTFPPLVSTPRTCPTCECTCPHHTQFFDNAIVTTHDNHATTSRQTLYFVLF